MNADDDSVIQDEIDGKRKLYFFQNKETCGSPQVKSILHNGT